MTVILLSEIETIWSAILIQLIGMLPAFLAVWFLFWLLRNLLIKD